VEQFRAEKQADSPHSMALAFLCVIPGREAAFLAPIRFLIQPKLFHVEQFRLTTHAESGENMHPYSLCVRLSRPA
jgi:hypothetical protein